MARWRAPIALSCFVAALWASTDARAEDRRAEDDRLFYKGRDYGSESLYNPLWVVANRGFDVLQVRPGNRSVYEQAYLTDVRNVLESVSSPFKAISAYGTERFVREELLPLSWRPSTARWIPNYSLHLLGGGQAYAELREWYMAHDASATVSTVFSIATVYTAALVNEAIENKRVRTPNTDAIADLCVFDLLGIVLFSVKPVRRFFAKQLHMVDWSLQPTITFPHGDMYNAGNYYAYKLALPFEERLRLFGYMGFSSMGGLSLKLARGYSVSAAFGGRVGSFDYTPTGVAITTRPTGAIFVDRNDSLLVKVQVADQRDYALDVNVYPNAFGGFFGGFGFFTWVGSDGKYVGGLSYAKGLGVGVGAGTR